MLFNSYTEDHLVEQPAIQLFAELGWETVLAMEEGLGPMARLVATLSRK